VYESYGNNSVVAAGDTASGSGNFSVSGGEHTHTPATTGSGSAHSNIQPSFVLAYYITT
jgi:microcystin-dependent protein